MHDRIHSSERSSDILLTMISISLVVSFSLTLKGQPSGELKFHQLTPNDGLSQATVFDIAQDSSGYIWIGTAEGLNKYNGSTFEVFIHDPLDSTTISYDYIRRIHIGDDDHIWIATAEGLNHYNRLHNNFRRIDTSGYPDSGLPDMGVTDVVAGHIAHTLWITTRNDRGLISLYNYKNQTFRHYRQSQRYEPINRITTDSEGILYMAHGDGALTSFDPYREVFNLIDTLGHDLLSIRTDHLDNIWLGIDYSGIKIYPRTGPPFRINTDTEGKVNMANNIPWDMHEDSNGNMYVATDGGLHVINIEDEHIEVITNNNLLEHSISSDFLQSVFIDRDQRIWAGSAALGLDIHDPIESKFNHVYQSKFDINTLSSNVIWSFEEMSDTTFLIGTSDGLNVYNVNRGITHTYVNDANDRTTISNNRVWSIKKVDSSNDYWLGTSLGLNHLSFEDGYSATFRSWQPDNKVIHSISANSVRCLLLENDSTLWLGTSNDGLNHFNIKTERFTVYKTSQSDPNSISGNRIRCITKTTDGTMWIGTERGLNRMIGLGVFQSYQSAPEDSTTLFDNNIRVITEGLNGQLWIGTDRGLNLISDATSDNIAITRQFTTEDGLPNNRIYSILIDKEANIWVSTNKGISRLNTRTWLFDNYNYNDGLQSDEFNQQAAFQNDSLFLIGGINGFNYFDPTRIDNTERSVALVFTDLEIEHKKITITPDGALDKDINLIDAITLKPGERSFTLGFTSLNFSNKKKDQFEYMLEGYDSDWYQSGEQHKAFYTNIAPGSYIFKVRTVDKSGKLSQNEIRKNIVIRPYIWQRRSSQFIALLLIALLTYLWYKSRVRSLVSAKGKLEKGIHEGTQKIEEQKQELVQTIEQLRTTQSQLIQQEKLASIGQLTAGIAHEINNPINFIKNSSEALEYDINDLSPLFEVILNVDKLTPVTLSKKINEINDKVKFPIIIKEINELVRSIKVGSSRTTEIVKSLRYFSHVNENRKELIDIHDPIESSLVILRNSYKDKIEIHRQFGKNIPLIKAKPGEINQVILNILNNAIQALDNKGNVWIKTEYLVDKVHVSISDDGPGIPDHIRDKIFEPFFTTKNVGSGSGLGLAISQGIISEHGGTLVVDDNHPTGAVFSISMPLGH